MSSLCRHQMAFYELKHVSHNLEGIHHRVPCDRYALRTKDLHVKYSGIFRQFFIFYSIGKYFSLNFSVAACSLENNGSSLLLSEFI